MRRPTLLIGAAVLAVGLVVALLPGASTPPVGVATLPDRVAGYSYLTEGVSAAPPGRAIALFQHGFGVEFLDFPQAVVVGADGEIYRRLDVAEDRADFQADPGPMLLAPDGTRVAVGTYSSSGPDLAIVELATGRTDLHPVPGGNSTTPVAWSADGRRLAYLLSAEPTGPAYGVRVVGDLGVLDLVTGQAAAIPGATAVTAAAFAPDGSELAVQRSADAGGALQIVGLDGAARRDLELYPGQRLDGPHSWSPDGALLVTTRAQECINSVDEAAYLRCRDEFEATPEVAFVDATGRGAPVPSPLTANAAYTASKVLGWTAADRVVVLASSTGPDQYWLTELPLGGGEQRRLSRVPAEDSNYGIGRFELAAALLPDIQVRASASPDRGRWPITLRLGVAVVLAAAACGVAALLLRRRRPGAGG